MPAALPGASARLILLSVSEEPIVLFLLRWILCSDLSTLSVVRRTEDQPVILRIRFRALWTLDSSLVSLDICYLDPTSTQAASKPDQQPSLRALACYLLLLLLFHLTFHSSRVGEFHQTIQLYPPRGNSLQYTFGRRHHVKAKPRTCPALIPGAAATSRTHCLQMLLPRFIKLNKFGQSLHLSCALIQ